VVGAFAAVPPLELRAHAQRADTGYPVHRQHAIKVVDLVLQQFAKLAVGPQGSPAAVQRFKSDIHGGEAADLAEELD